MVESSLLLGLLAFGMILLNIKQIDYKSYNKSIRYNFCISFFIEHVDAVFQTIKGLPYIRLS